MDHHASIPTFCAPAVMTGVGPVYGINGEVVRLPVKSNGPLTSPGGTLTTGAGAMPGPGGTPGPLVSIPDGVTPGPPLADRMPGTPGPVGGTTPGPARRGENPSGMPSLGSAGEGLRGRNGPVDVEGGRDAFIGDIEGEVVETIEAGARGGEVVSGRGNCDSPFAAGFEYRCGTGVWKRSGASGNRAGGALELMGPPGSPGPGVHPCRGEEEVEDMA